MRKDTSSLIFFGIYYQIILVFKEAIVEFYS
jgi:hypothetical protein